MGKQVKLTFLGDVLLDYKIVSSLQEKNLDLTDVKNYIRMFESVKNTLSQSDYVIANLESPVSYDNTNLTCKNFEFYSPLAFAQALSEINVNYVSTANNHCLDRGIQGLESTIKSLDKYNILHNGTYVSKKDKKPLIVDINGLKIGILSYTYGTNAYSMNNYLKHKDRYKVDLLQKQEGQISKLNPFYYFAKKKPKGKVFYFYHKLSNKLNPYNIGKEWWEKTNPSKFRQRLLNKDIKLLKKQKPDLMVMCLHIGEQYKDGPSLYTKKVIKKLKDKGINLIICNHEHLVQGHEKDINNNYLATYCLGNFFASIGVTRWPFDKMAEYSIALHIYVDVDNKNIKRATFSVFKTILDENGEYRVMPAVDLISKLPKEKMAEEQNNILKVANKFSNVVYEKINSEFDI